MDKTFLFGSATTYPNWAEPDRLKFQPDRTLQFSTAPNDFQPLKPSERGLVISSPIIADKDGFRTQGGIDQAELRIAVLFWDRIDWPTNNLIHFAESPDFALLSSEGFFSEREFSLAVAGAAVKSL